MQKTETSSVNPNDWTLAELQREINRIKSQNYIMRKLSTRKGFYEYYFFKLKTHKTTEEAFDYVNKQYQFLFGQYRYLDYNAFKLMAASNGN
jgi:hypothetical protein